MISGTIKNNVAVAQLLIFTLTSTLTFAQSNDVLAKSTYLQAEDNFVNKKYKKAIENLDKTIEYLGESNAKIEALYVKATNALNDHLKAEEHLAYYFEMADESRQDYMEMVKLSSLVKEKAQIAKEKEKRFFDQLSSNMVPVEGGTFYMGTNNPTSYEKSEAPAHMVKLNSFHISKYEVTQSLWKEIMNSNPSHNKGCDNCPVENVNWNDIQEFLRKLNAKTGKNYRLPTEAEWEYAARGNENFVYAGSDNIYEVAWVGGENGNSNQKSHPVGQKLPNGYGLYDMNGNVAEICNDWYDEEYYKNSPVDNPKGPKIENGKKVLRGCNFAFYAGFCELEQRMFTYSGNRRQLNGFRLVHD
jgi:formylglycine-generating enzyme required for sulfatase activity